MGTRSAAESAWRQCGQRECRSSIDSPEWSRWISAFRKLPTIKPKIKMKITADILIIPPFVLHRRERAFTKTADLEVMLRGWDDGLPQLPGPGPKHNNP